MAVAVVDRGGVKRVSLFLCMRGAGRPGTLSMSDVSFVKYIMHTHPLKMGFLTVIWIVLQSLGKEGLSHGAHTGVSVEFPTYSLPLGCHCSWLCPSRPRAVALGHVLS